MTQPEKTTPTAAPKAVVLIVDNDPASLGRLQRALQDSYTVHATANGVEAIKLIKALPEIHVLIVDEDLPRMKGTDLLRFLHEMYGKSDAIIKILLADVGSNGTAAEMASCGRIDFTCAKPVDPVKIRRKVGFLIAQKSHEKRTSMRVKLNGSSNIRIEAEGNGEAEVADLSQNGVFLKTMSLLPAGSAVPLKITLPDGRHYHVSGRVVRQDVEQGGVGVEFPAIDDQSRRSILQFLSDYVTVRDLDELKLRYPFLKTDDMVIFSEPAKIESLLREAMKSGVEVAALPSGSGQPEILSFADVRPPGTCHLAGEKLHIKFKTSDPLFVSFHIGYATYNFETMIFHISRDGKSVICLYPKVVFYSEKRIEKRVNPGGDLRIEVPLPAPYRTQIRGRITDISPGGVSFVAESGIPVLLKGTPLESIAILESGKIVWRENGEVRHVALADGAEGGGMKYGVQFGIGRRMIRTTDVPSFDSSTRKEPQTSQTSAAPASATVDIQEEMEALARRPPDVIHLENKAGEEIVGLLNSSLPLDGNPVPVVVIPPAFGKTKEVLFALALTLITNFRLQNRPLAVIRYDGIRRKGESHKDPEASVPPYEMVNASLSQGSDDTKAVLDWIEANPRLRASKVVLVTFSLSALEARLTLRDAGYRKKVHYWISCMGTPEIRHLLTRINCGLDILEQYQLGIQLGVIPILGNLVNIDRYMEDGVKSQLATLDQARQDMRLIDIPVTWIYGQHDHWVKSEFIRDVMSIKVGAEREVISMPLGHNARTSEEALKMFGTITSLIHRFIYGELPKPVIPSRKNMEYMRIAEKDRVPSRKLPDRQGYWERYLIGSNDLMGFDVLMLADDYHQLMLDQLQALDLKPEDRFLDLGGGTGNFVDHLLASRSPRPRDITIADLVPHALAQAKKKIDLKLSQLGHSCALHALILDLEMNRYNPVRRYLAGELAGFRDLVDKIENLTIQSASKIDKSYSSRLHRILRGDNVTAEQEDWLKRTFELPEYRTIRDLNAAARYVQGLEKEKPAYRQLIFSDTLETRLHLPVQSASYDKILMSLVLSYIFNPVETLIEIKRILKPGGLLVLSSLRPDADASGLFTRLAQKVETMDPNELPEGWNKKTILASIRSFMNDAEALVDLGEAGAFDFYEAESLSGLLEDAGFTLLRTIESFGDPPQGYVFIAGVKNGQEQR